MRLLTTDLTASLLRAAAFVSSAMLVAGPSHAASYLQNLSFFTASDLEDGVIGYQFAGGGGSRVNSFFVPATTEGPSTITDPFPKTEPATQLYFLGVSTDPDIAAGRGQTSQLLAATSARHLVIAANTLYSVGLVGREFGQVFAGFDEAELIEALDILGDGGLAEDAPGYQEQIDAASTRLFQFQDVLFATNVGFGSQDAFSLTSFSVGVPAGTGFASITPVGDVPEPATWATMLLGFGLVGGAARRRRGVPLPV